MRIIEIDDLEKIGSGCFANVYMLSPTRVIKVYKKCCWKSDRTIGRIMAEEVRLSRSSPHALPVLEIVIAKQKINKVSKYYYAVIKKYVPFTITAEEAFELRDQLPDRLAWDCATSNARKDENGKIYLIDTQGPYSRKHL